MGRRVADVGAGALLGLTQCIDDEAGVARAVVVGAMHHAALVGDIHITQLAGLKGIGEGRGRLIGVGLFLYSAVQRRVAAAAVVDVGHHDVAARIGDAQQVQRARIVGIGFCFTQRVGDRLQSTIRVVGVADFARGIVGDALDAVAAIVAEIQVASVGRGGVDQIAGGVAREFCGIAVAVDDRLQARAVRVGRFVVCERQYAAVFEA